MSNANEETTIPSGLQTLKRQSLTIDERAELLDDAKWAKEFQWEQLRSIAKYFDAYKLGTDTLIVKEGDQDASLIILVKGRVNVSKLDKQGKPFDICLLYEGAAFGEISLFDDAPRSASVKTDMPSTLLVLTKAHLHEFHQENPNLAFLVLKKIATQMAARLRQTSSRLAD